MVPGEHASSLAHALESAAQGEQVEPKPQWNKDREEADKDEYDVNVLIDAPKHILDRARRRMIKDIDA